MAEPVLAGIPAGGLKEGHEIKVLICYLLVSAGGAPRWEEICEVCCGEGLVDYFSLSTATQELERYGNILSLVGERGLVYQITGFGEETVKSLGKTLPASLREFIDLHGKELAARVRREKEIQTEIRAEGSGFQVSATLHEGELAFFSMSLYAPDREQAELIVRNFKKFAPELYGQMIEKLTQ